MKESITGEEGSQNWGQPSAAPPADLCMHVLTQLYKPHKTRHTAQPPSTHCLPLRLCVWLCSPSSLAVLLRPPLLCLSQDPGAGPFPSPLGRRMPPICLPMAGSTCSPPAHNLTRLFCVCWQIWPGSVFSWETIRLSKGIYIQMLCVHRHSFLELMYPRAHSRQHLGRGPPSSPLLNALLPHHERHAKLSSTRNLTCMWLPEEGRPYLLPDQSTRSLPAGRPSRWTSRDFQVFFPTKWTEGLSKLSIKMSLNINFVADQVMCKRVKVLKTEQRDVTIAKLNLLQLTCVNKVFQFLKSLLTRGIFAETNTCGQQFVT